MAPSSTASPVPYFAASGASALAFFPLWKAAAIGQSGYAVSGGSYWAKYWEAVKPPWRGSFVVIGGMTWARAAIFFGSDAGSKWLRERQFSNFAASSIPALALSAFVQVTNQPFVRSSVMLQNPAEACRHAMFPNLAMMKVLVEKNGLGSLWLGTNAGILKTAPKYMVAVVIKDSLGAYIPDDKFSKKQKSGLVSVTAGVAGAVLTNPFDAVRNEMFKTEEGLLTAIKRMNKEIGISWLWRGCEKNLIAVAAPIAGTIFLTDLFKPYMENLKFELPTAQLEKKESVAQLLEKKPSVSISVAQPAVQCEDVKRA